MGGPRSLIGQRHYPYFDFAETNMIEMGKDGAAPGSMGLVTYQMGRFFQ